MKTLIRLSVLFLLTTFVHQDLISQTKLSVQGVIRLSDGNAVDDGFYTITFKLYDTLTSGNLLWTEIQPQVKVTSGIYSTVLGEVTPLDLPFDQFYFLSLTIEGEELTPRAPLSSAPYANSMLGFDNVFPSTGNVGVGTLDPQEKVDIAGSMKADTIYTDDIFANSVHVPHTGSLFMSNLQSGNNGYYVTIDEVPASYVGLHKSVVLMTCVYGAAGASANVTKATVNTSTQLFLEINRLSGSTSTTFVFNYIIFPVE